LLPIQKKNKISDKCSSRVKLYKSKFIIYNKEVLDHYAKFYGYKFK